MAAHNPLCAKLAQEAGFGAVWVSGFELAASYTVPDASILLMNTHLEITRAMAEVQDLPLIADIDTGFGNAVDVAYVVPRHEAAGAAAVVIEDKIFPKDSSLRSGRRQILVPVPDFQGKIAAAKVTSPILVIARTEALIAGSGKREALRRGRRVCRSRGRWSVDPWQNKRPQTKSSPFAANGEGLSLWYSSQQAIPSSLLRK